MTTFSKLNMVYIKFIGVNSLLTNTLIPHPMGYKSNGAVTPIAAQHVFTAKLTHQIICTLISIYTHSACLIWYIAWVTDALVPTMFILTLA